MDTLKTNVLEAVSRVHGTLPNARTIREMEVVRQDLVSAANMFTEFETQFAKSELATSNTPLEVRVLCLEQDKESLEQDAEKLRSDCITLGNRVKVLETDNTVLKAKVTTLEADVASMLQRNNANMANLLAADVIY